MVDCIYNEYFKCAAGVVEITLTHDDQSKNEYIKCATYVCNPDFEANRKE
jgi:hypothetical protein